MRALGGFPQHGQFVEAFHQVARGDRADVAGRPDLGGYALFNLTARRRLDADWSLTARVDNLTDRDHQTAYGYNQPGRGFFVGLQWSPR